MAHVCIHTHCRCMTCSYMYTHTPPEESRGSWQLLGGCWETEVGADVSEGWGSVFSGAVDGSDLKVLEEDLSCGSQRSDAWIPFFLCCLPPPFLTPPPFISHHIAPKPTCCVLLWLLPLTNFPSPPPLCARRRGANDWQDRAGLNSATLLHCRCALAVSNIITAIERMFVLFYWFHSRVNTSNSPAESF